MVWAGQIKGKMTAEEDGDISGHRIISCKEIMREERKQRTSGSLLISFPLQARDWGSCHFWGGAQMSDCLPAQPLVRGGAPAALSSFRGKGCEQVTCLLDESPGLS